MTILAIETSCDETAAAVVEGRSPDQPVKVLASVVASSEEMHIQTGGIVPEVASREQLKAIIPVIQQVLAEIPNSKFQIPNDIDAVAVTVGPGLIGSLLVGVETAKTLAYVWGKPIIPVNHLVAHLYANFVHEMTNDKLQITNQAQKSKVKNRKIPQFPAVGLVVSGGHTDLVLMKSHGSLQWLGGTRDDAAGECFDKCSRLLQLGYPGGPAVAEAASGIKNEKLKMKNFKLPRPLMREDTYDFSFSGLKAALRRAALAQGKLVENKVKLLAHEVQEAVTDVLVAKVVRAVEEFRPKSVIVGGGVAANLRLREKLVTELLSYKDTELLIAKPEFCTDNAAMVGAAAFYNYSPSPWKDILVDPGLEITS